MKPSATRTLPSWLTSKPIAHRGLHSAPAVPENSFAAFEAAAVAGYPIELDVHLSADGIPVVFHDEDLRRMTGEAGAIRSLSAKELRGRRLAGTSEPIPLLSEVLGRIDGRAPFLIELKNASGRVGALEAAVLRELSSYSGEFAVQSFHPLTVAWFRRKAPQIVRGQLAAAFKSGGPHWLIRYALANLLLDSWTRPDFIAYDIESLPHPAATRTSRAMGRPLIAWTVRTEAQRQKAFREADNCIFEGILP